jgi:hypothetical protein
MDAVFASIVVDVGDATLVAYSGGACPDSSGVGRDMLGVIALIRPWQETTAAAPADIVSLLAILIFLIPLT